MSVYHRNADGTLGALIKACKNWKEAKKLLNRLYDEKAAAEGDAIYRIPPCFEIR